MDTNPKTFVPPYESSKLQEIMDKCSYLTRDQQTNLLHLLSKFPKLFDGELKTFKGPPIHLSLIDHPTPVCSQAYPVPRSQLPVFKNELDPLMKLVSWNVPKDLNGLLEPSEG